MKIFDYIYVIVYFLFFMVAIRDIQKRINEVFDYLIDNSFEKNKTTIAKTLGYAARQALWNAIGNYKPNSRSLLIRIGNAYPMVNTEWIATGEGEMVRGKGSGIARPEMMTDRFVKYLYVKNISTKDALSRLGWTRRIYDKALRDDFSAEEVLHIGTVFSDLNLGWLRSGVGSMLVISQEALIKILSRHQKEIDTLREKVQKLEAQRKDRKPV